MAGGSDDYVQYELNDWVQRRSFEHPEWFESKSVTKQGEQTTVQQMTSRAKHEDKTTGSYERFTAKQSMSSEHQVVERSGRVGIKDVQQKSATLRIGDKSGYTEYYSEQKVQRVNYDKNSYNSGNTSRSTNKY
ncbi:unnamed protein product [Camellia sinensis]